MANQNMSRRSMLSAVSAVFGAAAFGSLLEGCMAAVGDGTSAEGPVNQAWELEAERLESQPQVFDQTTNWTDGTDKAGTHVPELSIENGKVSVLVPHPMTPEHYITTVYLRDADGIVVAFRTVEQPQPGEESVGVTVAFDMPNTDRVTAYADCNLHDVWKSEPLTLVS